MEVREFLESLGMDLKNEKIETTHGWIFTDKDMQGKVFVNKICGLFLDERQYRRTTNG